MESKVKNTSQLSKVSADTCDSLITNAVRTPCPPCPCMDEIKVEITGQGWVLGSKCSITTPSIKLSGRYAVVPLKDLKPSNLPPDFVDNPKYPKGCNERKYFIDKSEQAKVNRYTGDFDPKFLINEDNTPLNGTMVIDEAGIVLGGNARTMILMVAKKENEKGYKKYAELLKKKIWNFGIDWDSIKNIQDPILVRIIRYSDGKNCNYYSRILNDGLSKSVPTLDKMVGVVKAFTEKQARVLCKDILSLLHLKTFKELSRTSHINQFVDSVLVSQSVIEKLLNWGIVNATNAVDYWYKDEVANTTYLTPYGIDTVKSFLYSLVFADKSIIHRTKNDNKISIDAIYSYLLYSKTLSDEYNLLPHFHSAILYYINGGASNDAKTTYGSKRMFTNDKLSHIEYLILELLMIKDNALQKDILLNYFDLYQSTFQSMFNKNDVKASPTELLEMAFGRQDKVKYYDSMMVSKYGLSDRKTNILDKWKQDLRTDWNKILRFFS